MKFLTKSVLALFLGILSLFCVSDSFAATGQLNSSSDTISTSRPSASAVLNTDQAANASQITVVDLGSANGLMYIASDSATFWAGTGETADYAVQYVASQSAQVSGTPNTRVVYMTSQVPHAHHKGDAVSVPITAMHTVDFTLSSGNPIPTSGKIILTFPILAAGENVNAASPSASTFQTNGLAQANFKVYDVTASSDITANFTTNSGSIAVTAATSGTAPVITLTQGTTTTVAASHRLKIFIGCTALTGSGANATCSTQVPTLINPVKSAATGTADAWRLQIDTQDASGNGLDTGKVKIDTIEAVQVYATVEPSLTFTIAGQNNGTNYNSITSSCGSETSNAGINSTPTVVNLGTLSNGTTNNIGQTLTISTNGASGYSLTATSSGRLINPATGYWIPDANGGSGLTANDTPVPATIVTGTAAFGISPCGPHVPTSSPNWGGTSGIVNSGGTSTALFSNPWNTGGKGYYASLSSYSGGPISGDITVVRYGATVTGTTPPGIYSTVFTYVATATF